MVKLGKHPIPFLKGHTVALCALALGCGSSVASDENVGQVAQAETVEFTPGAFIDRDAFIDRESLDRIPLEVPDGLKDLAGKVELLSKAKGGVDAAIWALQFLDLIDSPEDAMNRRFQALHDHLDQTGFQLGIAALIAARNDRMSAMQADVNVVERFSARSHGPIDESLLTPVEQVELGTALQQSQVVTQQAGNSNAFEHLFVEGLTAGEWKTYIQHRPGITPGLVKTPENTVFDWRWGLTQYVFMITSRLAVLGLSDPDFRTTGEHNTELGQYRTRLAELYAQMLGGVQCAHDRWSTTTVICADIYTGLTTKTTFQDSRCWGNTYAAAACDALIAQQKSRNERVLKTYMPLFEVRSMLDALNLIIDDAPDLTQESNTIQLRAGQSREGCLARTTLYEYETDPYSGTPIPGIWGTEVAACAGSSEQRWFYNRLDKTIRDEAGGCLMPQHDEVDDLLVVVPCSGRRSEHWTYDPQTGTIENAFHAVMTAPPAVWEAGAQWMRAQVRGAAPNQSWASAPAMVYDNPFGDDPVDVYVGSDPNDGYSQWIAWQDYWTGECWWDYLGDWNGLSADVHVRGGSGEDWLSPVPDGGLSFCGYDLVFPFTAGRKLFLEGGGGNDLTWVDGPNVSSTVVMGGEGDDELYTSSDGSEANVLGGPGNDRIIVWGDAGQGHFSGEQGNDCLWTEGSWLGRSSCGTGSDQWGGSGAQPADCEQTTASCF